MAPYAKPAVISPCSQAEKSSASQPMAIILTPLPQRRASADAFAIPTHSSQSDLRRCVIMQLLMEIHNLGQARTYFSLLFRESDHRSTACRLPTPNRRNQESTGMLSRFLKRVVLSPGKVQSRPDNYFGCLARPVYTCRHLEPGLSIGMHLLMGSMSHVAASVACTSRAGSGTAFHCRPRI
jgi:hypothetical protein